MRLSLNQLSEESTAVVVEESSAWAREAAEEAVEGEVLSLDGQLGFLLRHETLFVTGELRLKCRRSCDRCGGFLVLEIEGPVDLAYRPEIQSSEAVRELSNDDLDVGFYTGNSFEAADAVREHLALQLPFQVHCEIPGASSEGGECNPALFEEDTEEKVDPRFAILKELKFDN